ncbi:TIGR03013 family PEP-CTERM/XrtA system glycosyltransferase [Nitrosomonas sp. HPC101]|uniref:TIGR03013 family XrtA/PEP-CTERM system glycosyltransferase n=1 Tax=Nitrosomonas sp. HPC101 TaxID=1658667 RepID=UPI0013710B8F|nr:TIGR03013 family XrtA/PEP-CTERM system glycosyltransferase [Nitrosomonas sp. HPC101]MXS85175.1 TIGR03013 family PEP-CTERM/XrtA system glycosyltransferase [Nitrosomonas sp. HPC101]
MIQVSNHYISRFSVLLASIETVALLGVFFAGAAIRFPQWNGTISELLVSQFPGAITFTFIIIASMATLGMYQMEGRQDFEGILLRLLPSLALGFGLITLIFYLFPDLYFGRGLLAIVMLLALLLILSIRLFFFRWKGLDNLRYRALVLGTGTDAEELLNLADKSISLPNFRIAGFVPFDQETRCVPIEMIIPKTDSLISLAKQHNVSEIIVMAQERRGGTYPIQELLECRINGIKITDMVGFYEQEYGHLRMDALYPSWLVFGSGFKQGTLRTLIKRIFDITASLLLLIATLPVILLTALLILIEDGRPVFYRQERVGYAGKPYMVFKFRSMFNDAEKGGKPQWAVTDDPRVTRVGKVIRKLRIDELPQIINVLKGEMSFVGPRPERPHFVNILSAQVPYYNMRHSIKPGITGWAQVRYPYGASVEDAIEKLQYDLYYVKNHSLFLDFIILINTVGVVLLGKGSR